MPEASENKKGHDRRVHMANERTFLAWMRTSIGLMAFGFVVEKFALFVKQIAYFLQRSMPVEVGKAVQPALAIPPSPGYSSIFGVVLVALGAVMGLLSFIRYKKVERQINEDTYEPSLILDALLAMSVLAIGIFLVIYLLHSI